MAKKAPALTLGLPTLRAILFFSCRKYTRKLIKMSFNKEIEAYLNQNWEFFQSIEDSLIDRNPVILTDLLNDGSEVTAPDSLQQTALYVARVAQGDWTSAEGLTSIAISLMEVIEFWENIFDRHRRAAAVFAAAESRPYCLMLRSFSTVGIPVEEHDARVVIYLNNSGLDANFAAALEPESQWLNPLNCINTDDLQLFGAGVSLPSFRVHLVNWQEILKDAIASSGAILLYIDKDSPGVLFELNRIRDSGLEPHTVVVYREAKPDFTEDDRYAAVMSLDEFIDADNEKTGPGKISDTAKRTLQDIMANAVTRKAPSERLLSMPCNLVDPGAPAVDDGSDPDQSFFVTAWTASAFVSYIDNMPTAYFLWNEIARNTTHHGIQPGIDDINRLYLSLRKAFYASACLGFTASMALTLGLLCRVSAIVRLPDTDNHARIEPYMQILDIAKRFDALTKSGIWGEKIEAYRKTILTLL